MGHHYDEEQRDQAIADAARRHAAAIRTNILTGHEQTLKFAADDLAERMCAPGVTEQLIRSALSCGPLLAGQMLIDMVQKGIDADAELAAIREIERAEKFAKADPDNCRARTRAVAEFRAVAA